MNCATCGDWGLVIFNYIEGDEYGICLCQVGERWRIATNCGKPCTPLWQIEAHRRGIPIELFHPIENILTPEELADRGFSEPSPASTLDAIVAAAKHRGTTR